MEYVQVSDEADEIVNDAFMAVWDNRQSLELNQNLKPYLYTVVRNKSLNALKKKKIDTASIEDWVELPQMPHNTALDQLEFKETQALINAAIRLLPPRCQQIFILSRKEQFSHKQIAEIMDLSEKTIENQITIAIKAIKGYLKAKQ